MAGTWIKLRTNIFTDARIASIARKLKTDNFGIIGVSVHEPENWILGAGL